MDALQRVVLKDDVGFRKIHGQLVHIGLRFLAMGALEVGELHQLEGLVGRPHEGSVGLLLQLGSLGSIGVFTERVHVLVGDDVLAIGQDPEHERLGLVVLAVLVADVDDDLAQVRNRTRQDGFHLPGRDRVRNPKLPSGRH